MRRRHPFFPSLFLIALSLILLLFGKPLTCYAAETAYTRGPDIYGEAYCVLDADTGDIICGKNAMGMYYPASITKILTALVVLENVPDLDATLTFSETALAGIDSHSTTLPGKAQVGEQMSVMDCLYGMMLASSNECAAALAEYTAGSVEKFAEMMNARAKEIGAVNTHFVNANGLDNKEHYTSPYDMALIFREALGNETFRTIASCASYTIPATNMSGERKLTMGHQIVNGSIEYEGVYAGKTGRTALAGRTLATAAEHNGRNVIVIVMKCEEETFYDDTMVLLDYAYALIDGQDPYGFIECEEEMVASSGVNLREMPNTYARILGSLSEGQTVLCTGRYADWSRVVVDGKEYYANSAWLCYPDGSASPVTTATTKAFEETEEETAKSVRKVSGEQEIAEETAAPAPEEESEETEGSEEPEEESNALFPVLFVILFAVAAGIVLAMVHGKRKKGEVTALLLLFLFALNGCSANSQEESANEETTEIVKEEEESPGTREDEPEETDFLPEKTEEEEEETEPVYTYELALITDGSALNGNTLVRSAWRGLVSYAEENSVSYHYYRPEEMDEKSYREAVDLAVKKGAEKIFLTGDLMTETAIFVQELYPDVDFVLLDADADAFSEPEDAPASNLAVVCFSTNESYYLAGYVLGLSDETKVGFIGEKDDAASSLAYSGFLQGFCDGTAKSKETGKSACLCLFVDQEDAGWKVGDQLKSWYEEGISYICTGNSTALTLGENESLSLPFSFIACEVGETPSYDNQIASVEKDAAEIVEDLCGEDSKSGSSFGEVTFLGITSSSVNLVSFDEDFEKEMTREEDVVSARKENGELSYRTDLTPVTGNASFYVDVRVDTISD